jgi:hypothetical protein
VGEKSKRKEKKGKEREEEGNLNIFGATTKAKLSIVIKLVFANPDTTFKNFNKYCNTIITSGDSSLRYSSYR